MAPCETETLSTKENADCNGIIRPGLDLGNWEKIIG
jgi:hypothetical protein